MNGVNEWGRDDVLMAAAWRDDEVDDEVDDEDDDDDLAAGKG